MSVADVWSAKGNKQRLEGESDTLQKFHSVKSEIREAIQQARYWDALKNTCLLDSYLDGKCSFILNFDATFQGNNKRSGSLNRHSVSTKNVTVIVSQDKPTDGGPRGQFEQQEMFIRNIKTVKGPDNTILPAFVRLYFGDNDLQQCGANDIYFDPMQAAFKDFPSWSDGELG